jgi:phthalate 4,5-cis-dihydrodiol dehydrogenase
MTRRLRLGVAGLGRAFMLMLPTLAHHPRVQVVAACDPREEARARFRQDFGGRAHVEFSALCDDPDVDAIYLATPHQFHAAQAVRAAASGKHLLVEKPMAVTLAEAAAMVEAAERARIHLIIGHSHAHDGPILHTRRLIAGGAYGRLRMITALTYTDFLYRPRRPEELRTKDGGGVVFSQGAHQVDVLRLLGGGRVASVRAATGIWDAARPTEGAVNAFLAFEDGASATLTYSGHGRFDTDALQGWIGETGTKRDPTRYGAARAALAATQDEVALKRGRGYGAPGSPPGLPPAAPPAYHNHFGLVLASCERADFRPDASGVTIYADSERRFEATPLPVVPRGEVLDALASAVLDGAPPLHDARWGMATLEVVLALLQSAREGREITLKHQVATRDA